MIEQQYQHGVHDDAFRALAAILDAQTARSVSVVCDACHHAQPGAARAAGTAIAGHAAHPAHHRPQGCEAGFNHETIAPTSRFQSIILSLVHAIAAASRHTGGTSVLADLFMSDPHPSIEAQCMAFHFGVALQLLDDLQAC